MSNKRRKITLSKNNLDPLSRWYFSNIKIGNVFTFKASNPVETDNRLFINPNRDQAGLGGISPNDPHVTWDLAGTYNDGEGNRQPTEAALRDFVRAATATQSEMRVEFSQRINPFIYKEKSIAGEEEAFYSFPAQIIDSLLESARIVVAEAQSPMSFNRELNVDGEFDRFAANIRGTNSDLERYLQRKVNEVRARPGVDNISDIIRETLAIVSIDTDVAQGRFGGDTQKAVQYLTYIFMLEIRRIVSDEAFKEVLLGGNDFEYNHHYVEIDTPYVSTKNSSNFLEELSSGEPYRSGIKSDYSYFIRGYEENTVDDSFSENLLPNNYARHYFRSLAYKRATSGPLSPDEERKYQEFRTILGLSDDIKDEALLDTYESFYYSSYGKAVENIDLDSSDIRGIASRGNVTIFDSTQVGEVGLSVGAPPMDIGIEFTRDAIGDTVETVTGQVSEGLNDVTSIIFDNIGIQNEDEFRTNNLYATEYLKNQNNAIEEKESPFAIVQLREFPVRVLLTQVPTEPGFGPLVLNTAAEINPQYVLSIRSLALGSIANNNSRRSYGSIVSANDSRSETLGYRIRKTLPNNRTQDFFIGNGEGDKVVTYRDSQVKYGKEYSYTLSEYRLIYGTKYKFRTYSSNFPLWVIGNYLGFIGDRATEEIISNLESVPRLSIDAYVQEEAQPVVTEIPIYDEVFNTQNIFNILSEEEVSGLLVSDIGGQGAISYPRAKVLDRPPTAPILDVFPMVGAKDQIKLGINLQTGNNTGANAREIISIGDMSDKIRELKQYQDTYANRYLPPKKLEYKNEGLAELRNIILYRTTKIDLDVENYNDIYKSFNPEINPLVSVRKFTDQSLEGEEFSDVVQIPSYELRDTIQPNTNYYYTCIVEDFHGNPSNPSIIYRVRLLFDKGLLIPEIDTVNPMGENNKKPQKNLARYMQIDASNIQTLPYVNTAEEGFTTERSLGYSLGKSIENQAYILRLTSKDTGRKFDVKLNFVVRVDGAPINEGT
jgi:hypothetical protein